MSSDPVPLITIPAAVATHVLGDTTVQLGEGDLTLVPAPPAAPSSAGITGKTPVLTLTVGKAAFPLFNTTLFGTLAGDERVYVFSPEIGEPGSYVKTILPEGVTEAGSRLASLQEQFEQILIDHGLLTNCLEAEGDTVVQSVTETAASAAAAAAAQNVTKTPAAYQATTTAPITVPEPAHTASSKSASESQPIAQQVTSAVVTEQIVPSETGQVAEAEARAAATARDVVSELANSVQNVTGAVGEAAIITTGVALAGAGFHGTVVGEIKPEAEQTARSSGEGSEWDDVPM